MFADSGPGRIKNFNPRSLPNPGIPGYITCRDKLIFQISRVDYDDRSQTVFADVGRLLYPILVTLPQSVGFSQKKWKLLEEEILVTLP